MRSTMLCVEDVARDYDITREVVEQAVVYERAA
jgi:hypothetical protein